MLPTKIKEQTIDTCNNRDGSQDAIWKKRPISKGYLLWDSIYIFWNGIILEMENKLVGTKGFEQGSGWEWM